MVSWGTYFALLLGGRRLFGISPDDAVSAGYIAIYTAAQLISWVCATIFSFYTNRAFVFTDADKDVSRLKQLITFSSGRFITLWIDYVITYAGAILLLRFLPGSPDLAETTAKLVSAVIVVITNYIFGKLFVFRKKKEKKER